MKTDYCNLRLVFSGETVLLLMSSALFLASVANGTQWAVLRNFRFCGICTLLLSLTFGILSSLQLRKPERQTRTIGAAVLIRLSQGNFVIKPVR